jgi:hypothetical protein
MLNVMQAQIHPIQQNIEEKLFLGSQSSGSLPAFRTNLLHVPSQRRLQPNKTQTTVTSQSETSNFTKYYCCTKLLLQFGYTRYAHSTDLCLIS